LEIIFVYLLQFVTVTDCDNLYPSLYYSNLKSRLYNY